MSRSDNSPRPRRRIKIWVAVTATAFVAVAALAFLAFQVSTRQALERAEALRFTRAQVSRQADQNVFRFFFATNRQLSAGSEPLEDRFTNERANQLSLGTFDTSIEPSLGLGMLINPTDWFQNEEIQMHEVRQLENAEFIKQLSGQVEASPYKALLVNINGFRERFPSALRKTAFLAHVLDIDAPLIVFDWPGDQGSTPRGYRRAQVLARESAIELADGLKFLVERVQPERLWILANSMGGEVVVSAISLLHEQSDWADADTEIDHVVLTAPDVSHADFGLRIKPKILALSRNLTVYVSSNDRALLMSRVLNRGRRLGESTVNTRNPDQSDEALKVFDMVAPGADDVALIDITPVNRTRNFHNFSLETPEFFDDLYLRLINDETPRSRRKYLIRTAGGRVYWVLTSGR